MLLCPEVAVCGAVVKPPDSSITPSGDNPKPEEYDGDGALHMLARLFARHHRVKYLADRDATQDLDQTLSEDSAE